MTETFGDGEPNDCDAASIVSPPVGDSWRLQLRRGLPSQVHKHFARASAVEVSAGLPKVEVQLHLTDWPVSLVE